MNLKISERECLKKLLKKGYDFIARDKNGAICVFDSTPYKGEFTWHIGSCIVVPCESTEFSFISWEDEEPKSIRKLLEE